MPWVVVVEAKWTGDTLGVCGPYPDEKTALAQVRLVEPGKGAWPDIDILTTIRRTLNADDGSAADDPPRGAPGCTCGSPPFAPPEPSADCPYHGVSS